ncbi:MAG: UDP-3-O-[3-hydroxymyristoyl] N-acetylglucosamine deacetylase [Candidatus Rokuibacteriota bacterium]|nr:MAG: UDP-3-O-[3-hydroxymyristoyl] N-acetylglucosamine deacetylase [Candidatus Rokubacteria bacterium]
MDLQQTIRTRASLAGIGLHSGVRVRMTLSPAAPDTGILFRAADGTYIPASADHVVDTRSATTVGAFGVKVRSIEHLMAAASGLGIDNLLVDVDAEEIPAADGSAKPFVELIYTAGKVSLPAPRQPILIRETIRVGDESRWLQILPSDSFRISYTLDNHHPAIGLQVASFAVTEASFVAELAAARTYGFLRDVPMMRQNGLARGGSLDNAVVVGKRIVLNDSLRFADEFVRHKILDLVGDLAILARPVIGHVIGKNAGHALNHQLVVAIQKSCLAARRAGVPRNGSTVLAQGAAGHDNHVPGVAAV